jgi:Winged helix DNA-binding domain
VPEVGWEEVRARRVARSWLDERAEGERLVGVVGALCGVQAQVQTSAELQLAARVEGVVQTDVRAALWEQRALVRAWTVRGTLHLHPAEDLALWQAARRAAAGPVEQGLPEWRDPAGVHHPPLAADEVEAVRAAVWDALDRRCLLRDELADEVVKRVGETPRDRLSSGFAFFIEDLCQGPPQGSRITLTRPDQWIEGWRAITDEQEALREVCRRFLRTYGPARPADFCAWFGSSSLKVPEAQALFDSLGSELEELEVEGRRCFVLAGDRSFPMGARHVRLLPEYDVYVMGFREREQLVPQSVRELIAKHGRGRYEGPAGTRLVLVDGMAAGLWERKRRGKRVELDVQLVRRDRESDRIGLEREAERIGAFLGLEPVLSIVSS